MTWKNTLLNGLFSAMALLIAIVILYIEPKNPRLELGFNIAMGLFGFFLVMRVLGPIFLTVGYHSLDGEAKAWMDSQPIFRWFIIKEDKY